MWLDPERGVGVMLCPLPGTDAWQFQGAAEAPEGEPGDAARSRTYAPPTLETLQRMFDRYAGMSGVRLHDATWLSTYRVNVRMAERFRAGRVFLAGDAAHVHSIAGGLGMNTGIQDAYNLGWKLALVLANDATPALLDSYEAERLPIAAWTLSVSSERQRAVIAAARAMDGGVDAGLTSDTTQLGLHYRWSALAGGGEATGALRSGDRAPDARCHTRDGVEARLFDVYRGPHATLLGFGARTTSVLAEIGAAHGARVRTCTILQPGEALATSALATLVDVHTEATDCYGLSDGDLVLVRPDGYVAAIDHDADPRRITRWLASLTTDAPLASTAVADR